MGSLLLLGRVVNGNRLMGGKFISLYTGKTRFISIYNFKKLFNKYNVLNCTYSEEGLKSRWSGLNIQKLNKYDTNCCLIKKGYSEESLLRYTFKNYSTIISGAITDPDSDKANMHAIMYYNLIRKMTNDTKRIANNTGRNLDEIQKIKEYAFINEHKFLDGSKKRFDPDCSMAQSWQRLAGYMQTPIQPHDLIMLDHEWMELQMVESGVSQEEAHMYASKKYNYAEESRKYYKALREGRKNC